MAEIVNLRLRRKQAAREAGRQAGAENAARHGLKRGERARQAAAAELQARRLDGHRIDRPTAPPPTEDERRPAPVDNTDRSVIFAQPQCRRAADRLTPGPGADPGAAGLA
jgi:hypothetical protein